MNKIPSLPSENSKSNREQTATCYGVLSSNTEVYQVLCGTEKGDLATCRGHGESPGEVTFELRYGEKEFFQMEKGREGLFTHSKWHEHSRDRNKPGVCSETEVRWKEGGGRGIRWHQILKDFK